MFLKNNSNTKTWSLGKKFHNFSKLSVAINYYLMLKVLHAFSLYTRAPWIQARDHFGVRNVYWHIFQTPGKLGLLGLFGGGGCTKDY